ncbi:hypothetical protein GW626_18285 [Peribacillus muralis]|uniref:hypothetical protein n=1 Tax=Peribacillus muralis TaxID=264697 RepID=UPI001F4DB6ED|nr:hypothetical protein [Peribacillus muralis]MCK1992307.1 hypothetical protein [Peribacillus muralis]MCK2012863.1 hypothetical protein [Peribacillus muralis]
MNLSTLFVNLGTLFVNFALLFVNLATLFVNFALLLANLGFPHNSRGVLDEQIQQSALVIGKDGIQRVE